MLLTFCLYKRKNKREYEIHKDAIRGNEKTDRNEMKGTEETGKGGCSGEISNQSSVV